MVNKGTQINIKISEEDKVTLEQGAKKNNESMASFVRRCALRKADKILEKNREENGS